MRALLITRGNRFLEKALRAAPGVQLTVVPTLTDPASSYDLVVLDDIVPAVWPAANLARDCQPVSVLVSDGANRDDLLGFLGHFVLYAQRPDPQLPRSESVGSHGFAVPGRSSGLMGELPDDRVQHRGFVSRTEPGEMTLGVAPLFTGARDACKGPFSATISNARNGLAPE